MPTTRSQTPKVDREDASSVAIEDTNVKKRKSTASSDVKPSKEAKKQKQQQQRSSANPAAVETSEEKGADAVSQDAITINRAPVLELWAASVAHFMFPSMSWATCLSVGGAISTITAISKGRAIGKMDKPDPGIAEEKRLKQREAQANLDDIEVMGFHLHIKDGNAMVGDKPKKSNEDVLMKKYGPQNYERAKDAFAAALTTWQGREDELDKEAFHMYEDMRPNVPAGQKGWGRKGQLSLATIESVVRSSA